MSDVMEVMKSALWDFAMTRKVPEAEIHGSWSLDYECHNDFIFQMINLSELMRINGEAIGKGDLLTARCSLVEAQGVAHILSDLFFALKEDILRVADENINRTGDGNLDWPMLPQRCEYPREYGYRDAGMDVRIFGSSYKWNADLNRWDEV